MPTQEQVLEALKKVRFPGLSRDIVSFGFVRDVHVDGGNITFTIQFQSENPAVGQQLARDAEAAVRTLIDRALQEPGMEITIDLESTEITIPQRGGGPGWGVRFSIDSFFRECLLNGWDEVALTLRHETEIARYEAARSTELPAIA